MAVSVTHATAATGTNDASKQVSVNAWNEDHAISGLGSAAEADASDFAAASHTHAISDVTNLQTTLDGKAASSHTHTASQITDYAAPADAELTATVSWSAGTAPSGSATNRYAFGKIGKAISLEIRLKYAVAGATVTGVDIDLPSPAPLDLTGVADGDMITAGTAYFTTNLTSNTSTTRCILVKDSGSATGYKVRVFGSSGSYIGCVIQINYLAA